MKRRRASVVVSKFGAPFRGGALPLIVIGKKDAREDAHDEPESKRQACQELQQDRIHKSGKEKELHPIPSSEGLKNFSVPVVAQITINIAGICEACLSHCLRLLTIGRHVLKTIKQPSAKRSVLHVVEASCTRRQSPSHYTHPYNRFGSLFAPPPADVDICHVDGDIPQFEGGIENPTHSIKYGKAEHGHPQKEQGRRKLRCQQSDQHARQYCRSNLKFPTPTPTPHCRTAKVAPDRASGTWCICSAHRFGFQARTFDRTQLQQQLILEPFADHRVCATLSVNDNTQVASRLLIFNQHAPSGIKNLNHA